jgi:hypothetical protein
MINLLYYLITAQTKEISLDKEQTSYHDLLDGLRQFALLNRHLVMNNNKYQNYILFVDNITNSKTSKVRTSIVFCYSPDAFWSTQNCFD